MLKEEARTLLAGNNMLRAGINLGNPVLAQPVQGGRGAKGVSVELSDRLAAELGVPVLLVCFDHASRSFEAIVKGEVDIAFLAIDPERAEKVTFSDPYVQIEGTYLVLDGADVASVVEIDRQGFRIASSKGSAYDLHLSRTLKHAELIDTHGIEAGLELLRSGDVQAIAGIRQVLGEKAAAAEGLRTLDDSFLEIRQAICIPKSREAAIHFINDFIREMVSSGLVAEALTAS